MKRTDCEICVFPAMQPKAILAANDQAFAFRDRYSTDRQHIVIVPRHHKERLSEVSADTFVGMVVLLGLIRADLKVGDSNIVIDDGQGAGQMYPHTSLSFIPRFEGDFGDKDPRTGIRLIFPDDTYSPSILPSHGG
jgi:diadenosine tetraphosphate (Ap4A) HIT family hydrolase